MSTKGKHDWHHFARRWCPWVYCGKCGMVALNNDESRKAARKPCPGSEE